VLVGLAGVAVIRGQAWGRFTGIAPVGLSLIANFMFLPHYPLWAILIIAWDVAIISGHSRCTGRTPREPRDGPGRGEPATGVPPSDLGGPFGDRRV
jgi:hypothetical protein